MKAIKFFIIFTIFLLTSCNSVSKYTIENVEVKEEETLNVDDVTVEQIIGRVGDDLPLTKGELVRVIALSKILFLPFH